MRERIKILYDTDIGTNIDDALALAYLLKNPECDLLGVTTVTGKPQVRAAVALEMCEEAGIEVPVYPGSEIPLVIRQQQTGLSVVPEGTSVDGSPWEAVQFLRSTIRAYPGEITLLTTGPFSNIALLFILDPEIPSLLKGMVSMAGVFSPDTRKVRSKETNIALDPHAAARVFSMSPKTTRIAGLDVTLLCMKTGEEIADLLPCFPFPSLVRQISSWLKKEENIFFHDPLAAVLTCNPDLCTWQQDSIAIDTESGGSINTSDRMESFSSHFIAQSVDTKGFFDEYFGKIQ